MTVPALTSCKILQFKLRIKNKNFKNFHEVLLLREVFWTIANTVVFNNHVTDNFSL